MFCAKFMGKCEIHNKKGKKKCISGPTKRTDAPSPHTKMFPKISSFFQTARFTRRDWLLTWEGIPWSAAPVCAGSRRLNGTAGSRTRYGGISRVTGAQTAWITTSPGRMWTWDAALNREIYPLATDPGFPPQESASPKGYTTYYFCYFLENCKTLDPPVKN